MAVQLSQPIEYKNPFPWFTDMRFATVAEAEANVVWDESKIFLIEADGKFYTYEDDNGAAKAVPLNAESVINLTFEDGILGLVFEGGNTLEIDLNISNIDNTSDLNKPCSIAQDAAYKEYIVELATAGVILQEGREYIIPSTCELQVDADFPTVQIGRSFAVTNKTTLTQNIGTFQLIAGTAASFVYYNGEYIEYSNNIE